jgi:hypothetical protein
MSDFYLGGIINSSVNQNVLEFAITPVNVFVGNNCLDFNNPNDTLANIPQIISSVTNLLKPNKKTTTPLAL